MGKSHTMADQQNLILSRLPRADFQLLEPSLEPADLPLRKVLERGGKPIKAVYFPETGFASVVANGDTRPIEVGVIGREGMTGLPVVLGGDRNEHETFMQAAGHGHCLRAQHLREAMAKSRTLQASFLRYVQAFLTQTAQTAVANGRSKIEERLARWLLMADDRIHGDELPLTHEFLAMMLAVRRPGVTVAIQELERQGVISRKRGRILIVDRKALEKMSNGTYVAADYQ
jgi:CRP-like cAMP-binding protein